TGGPAESLADPDVGAALADEGASRFGEDEGVGYEEEDREDECPGEGLRSESRGLGENFDAQDRRHDDEYDVESAERLLQMLLLFVRVCGRAFEGRHHPPPCERASIL